MWTTLPLTWTRFTELMSDPKHDAIDFYEENFSLRPLMFFSGGRRTLLKLSQNVIENSENPQSSKDGLGRFINTEISSTSSGNPSHSEMIVAWESSYYTLNRRITQGSVWHVFTILATFILTIEKIYSYYRRTSYL